VAILLKGLSVVAPCEYTQNTRI
ncbi:hypothetical protein A2U01_0010977, partial [Trifolium medium]|nr:hypothetical protein [Trifolium medium]